MAKKSMIARDAKRAELCDKYAEKEQNLKRELQRETWKLCLN